MAGTVVCNYSDLNRWLRRGPGDQCVFMNGRVHHYMKIASSDLIPPLETNAYPRSLGGADCQTPNLAILTTKVAEKEMTTRLQSGPRPVWIHLPKRRTGWHPYFTLPCAIQQSTSPRATSWNNTIIPKLWQSHAPSQHHKTHSHDMIFPVVR